MVGGEGTSCPCYPAVVGARGWIIVSLAVATLLTYSGIRNHDFVNYDDRYYVQQNPMLVDPLSSASLARALRPHHSNWIPVNAISLQLDAAIAGFTAPAFLFHNLLLHTGAAVLLFLAFARMTGAPWPSAFVAGVFALHPLHVESVAWVSERKDVLAGFFWMLTLVAYAAYAEKRTLGRYAIVCIGTALGLLSKPTVITLPAVLLLLDVWPFARIFDARDRRRALLEKLPLFALALAAGAVTFVVQSESHSMLFAEQLSASVRFANAVDAIFAYLADSIWPSNLSAFYPYTAERLSAGRAISGGLLLAAISVGCVAMLRRRPWFAVGWAWFLTTLLPTLGIVQVGLQARADRYMYIPLTGLAVAVAFGVSEVVADRPRARTAAAAAAVAVLLAFAVGSTRQVDHWRSSLALFEHAAAVTQNNFYAHNGIAGVHLEAGRLPSAEHHYRESIRMDAGWAQPWAGLANVELAKGDLDAAASHYRRALAIDADHPVSNLQLGVVLLERGDARAALVHLERARLRGPESPELSGALGVATARLGDADAAAPHLEAALARRPELEAAAVELAWIRATSDAAALADAEDALRLARELVARTRTDRAPLLDVLAAALAATGRFDEALATASRGETLARKRGNAELAQAIDTRRARYARGLRALPPYGEPT